MATRAPLVPPEVDLRDFPFMPLDVRRLLSSETWVLGSAEEKVAAINLWCEAWHQVPAGSLPANERMLAHLSQAGPGWRKVREHAMRGWILCSDGRFYHPVIVEKVAEAWEKRRKQRERSRKGHAARWGSRPPAPVPDEPPQRPADDALAVPAAAPEPVPEACPEHALSIAQAMPTDAKGQGQGQREGQGQGGGDGAPKPPAHASAPAPAREEPPDDPPDDPDREHRLRVGVQPGPASPAGRIAATLHGWCRERRKQFRGSPASPEIRGWIDAGVTDETLRAAFDLAAARLDESSGWPLNPAYLHPIVESVHADSRKPPAAVTRRSREQQDAESIRRMEAEARGEVDRLGRPIPRKEPPDAAA